CRCSLISRNLMCGGDGGGRSSRGAGLLYVPVTVLLRFPTLRGQARHVDSAGSMSAPFTFLGVEFSGFVDLVVELRKEGGASWRSAGGRVGLRPPCQRGVAGAGRPVCHARTRLTKRSSRGTPYASAMRTSMST